MCSLKVDIKTFPLHQVDLLSQRDRQFCAQDDRLSKHQVYSPDMAGIEAAIKTRANHQPDRKTLVEVIKKQYSSILEPSEYEKVISNINLLLSKNTFTITTAHQPVLFGGPLYTFYKIAGAINLCKKLNSKYHTYNFIPTYVIGSEDHDFDEMKSIQLYQKKITWQTDESGSVGRMSNEGIIPAIEELRKIIGQSKSDVELLSILKKSFISGISYAQAYQNFIHQIFGSFGLLIINLDEKKLKSNFSSILKDELVNQSAKKHVLKIQNEIKNDGLATQVFARDINLFYQYNGFRKRIDLFSNKYTIVDTPITFTQDEILKELAEHPEKFSPNVVLRPAYQEFSLPNLAYIGGGGELAYWIEEVNVFKHHNIHYPILLRRNSAIWLQKKDIQQMQALDWDVSNIFTPLSSLIKNYLNSQDATIDVQALIAPLTDIFDNLHAVSEKENLNLKNYINGQNVRVQQQLEQAIKKIEKTIKQRFDIQINRLEKTHNKLFPDQKLQERKNSFIPIYSQWGSQFMETLVEKLNPLDFSFICFVEK